MGKRLEQTLHQKDIQVATTEKIFNIISQYEIAYLKLQWRYHHNMFKFLIQERLAIS